MYKNAVALNTVVSKHFVSLYKMKVLRLFMGLYIMLLSVMPCSDVAECSESTTISIGALEDHADHSQETELCSPFCTCICCGVSTDLPMGETTESDVVVFASGYVAHYQAVLPLEVALVIWQPPKIS